MILDRDGVINHDSDDYVKSKSEWRPIAGSLDAIARLCRAGRSVVVVTNQSGLARGLFDRAMLDEIHAEMRRQVEAAGGHITEVFVCPHAPGAGCACRKPQPGLLHAVAESLGVSVAGVPFVGDKRSDVEAARAAGCSPVLVRTGHGARTLAGEPGLAGVSVYDDLAAAVDAWLQVPPPRDIG